MPELTLRELRRPSPSPTPGRSPPRHGSSDSPAGDVDVDGPPRAGDRRDPVRPPSRPRHQPDAGGELLAQDARQLLVHAHEVHVRFAAVEADAVGQVNVGSLVTVAPIVLPRLVSSFNESLPNVAVNVRTGRPGPTAPVARPRRDPRRDHLRPRAHRQVRVPPRDRRRALAVLPGSHRLASRTSLHLSELADEPYILLDLPLSRQYFTLLFLILGPAVPTGAADRRPQPRALAGGERVRVLARQPATRQRPGARRRRRWRTCPWRPRCHRCASASPGWRRAPSRDAVQAFVDFASRRPGRGVSPDSGNLLSPLAVQATVRLP